jgi:extracellular factor (EF) 3-hydroxypalmitic acid methyl ester biosynthesis protein
MNVVAVKNQTQNCTIELQSQIESFCALAELLKENMREAQNELFSNIFISHIHSIARGVISCEQARIEKDEIQRIISPAVAIHGRSPLINRLQTWPRGYPGDYETIEYICAAKNKSASNTVEYYCEEYVLQCPAAGQHRNKIQYQAEKILHAVLNCRKAPKVLSVSCSNNYDIRSIIDFISGEDFTFILNDVDEQALAFAENELKNIKDKCIFIDGNLLSSLKCISAHGPFDLIVFGGVFDYFPDKLAVFALKHFYHKMLKPGGEIFFSNISETNPYRAWMEYFGNWKLKGRSPDELNTIFTAADIDENCVSIKKEATGLTYLVDLKNGCRR